MRDGLGEPLGADGLNGMRALILAAYYQLRRTRSPEQIGTTDIAQWIEATEPDVTVPSAALLQQTLTQAGVSRRRVGRPAKVSTASPLLRAVRTNPPRDTFKR